MESQAELFRGVLDEPLETGASDLDWEAGWPDIALESILTILADHHGAPFPAELECIAQNGDQMGIWALTFEDASSLDVCLDSGDGNGKLWLLPVYETDYERLRDNIHAEIKRMERDLRRLCNRWAQRQGKTIRVQEQMETFDAEILTTYMTDDEFLEHYRGHYECCPLPGRDPIYNAEQALDAAKDGTFEPQLNDWFSYIYAEWIGDEEELA